MTLNVNKLFYWRKSVYLIAKAIEIYCFPQAPNKSLK